MSEENTTQNPGLILPDDAPAVERVAGTDRLLAFNEAGDPVTATPPQLREYAAAGLVSTEAMTAALAQKAPLIPESLEEQLVPGEFWDGKQVYVRSFKGSVHGAVGGNYIAKDCFKSNTVNIVEVKGSVNGFLAEDNVTRYSLPVGTSFSVRAENSSLAYSTDRADMGAMIYTLTVKYTL